MINSYYVRVRASEDAPSVHLTIHRVSAEAGEKAATEQKEAEEQFQKINDAYEFLTDAQRKRLWDQGFDREEIEQLAIDASDALYQVHGTVFDPINSADLCK